MEKKGKIIIGAVIVILIILIGGFLLLSGSDVTLEAGNSTVTLPSDYIVNDEAVAQKGNISISFIPTVGGSASDEKLFYSTIKEFGKDSGYENVTSTKINGYKVYDFAASSKNLKNVSTKKTYSGTKSSWTETWKDYTPDATTSFFDKSTDHFRFITYVNGDEIDYLLIGTSSPDDNLYSAEIENIIDSIAPLEK